MATPLLLFLASIRNFSQRTKKYQNFHSIIQTRQTLQQKYFDKSPEEPQQSSESSQTERKAFNHKESMISKLKVLTKIFQFSLK